MFFTSCLGLIILRGLLLSISQARLLTINRRACPNRTGATVQRRLARTGLLSEDYDNITPIWSIENKITSIFLVKKMFSSRIFKQVF